MSYDSYRILLDEPASLPGLGFAAYAAGLADIITTSQPRFAIGIFGGWGSGKTTLMQAIETQLETRPEVVTLWFSAWRFEREDNMIVPLIDVLREALSRLAENDLEPARRAKARIAADRIARAGRALLAGIKVRAVIPGLNVELEAGKVIDAFERGSETASADGALSFYHAGFTMLDDAIKTFVGHGADRIVIFVDDLDRCLPAKALEVLESMKVFFDTKGVVFVVGLDRNVVEQAVRAKFDPVGSDAGSSLRSIEYLKKIFQVPFALPRITTSMLGDYLDHVIISGALSPERLLGNPHPKYLIVHLRAEPVLQLVVGSVSSAREKGAGVISAGNADVDRHLGGHRVGAPLQRVQVHRGPVESQRDPGGANLPGISCPSTGARCAARRAHRALPRRWSRLIPLLRAPNGATMRNAQPPPWLAAGLPLPPDGLPVRLLCCGATAGDPPGAALTAGAGLDDGLGLGGGVVATGGGDGAGTDET